MSIFVGHKIGILLRVFRIVAVPYVVQATLPRSEAAVIIRNSWSNLRIYRAMQLRYII